MKMCLKYLSSDRLKSYPSCASLTEHGWFFTFSPCFQPPHIQQKMMDSKFKHNMIKPVNMDNSCARNKPFVHTVLRTYCQFSVFTKYVKIQYDASRYMEIGAGLEVAVLLPLLFNQQQDTAIK